MDLPSYRYPRLSSIGAVLAVLGGTWINLKKIARLTGLKEWRVRSSLAFLVSLDVTERARRGRLYFYRLWGKESTQLLPRD